MEFEANHESPQAGMSFFHCLGAAASRGAAVATALCCRAAGGFAMMTTACAPAEWGGYTRGAATSRGGAACVAMALCCRAAGGFGMGAAAE
jgi:hypothetical protein